MSETIEDLIASGIASGLIDEYTREQFDADRLRLTARLCTKHSITESEIDAQLREHRSFDKDDP